MNDHREPVRTVKASAPMRICDIGGWTDTWFSGHGKVFNVAVAPLVEVRVDVFPAAAGRDRLTIDARNFADRYAFDPEDPPGRQPLLEAIVTEMGVPDELEVEITVSSEVPAGCSTGTSAATSVVLIGALDALATGSMTVDQIASAAHRIEVERLGLESGVQDQLCAVHGGINLIEIVAYPQVSVSQLQGPEEVWSELERRLLLVYLGRAHVSSEVHEQVIATLKALGGASPSLEKLRRAAQDAWDALGAGDYVGLGQAMTDNVEGQRGLHPGLVSSAAEELIRRAEVHGALGWKVNGAGGEGGSMTILCGPDPASRRSLVDELGKVHPGCRAISIRLSRDGLRVWEA